jgi:hypothetical protein
MSNKIVIDGLLLEENEDPSKKNLKLLFSKSSLISFDQIHDLVCSISHMYSNTLRAQINKFDINNTLTIVLPKNEAIDFLQFLLREVSKFNESK